MRGELLDEVAHEAAQESAAAEADLGHAGLEQLTGIQHHQIRIQVRVHRHARHDTNAQPEPDIGLDHVSVGCGENHLRRKPTMAEGFVELGAPGETEHVGHDRVLGQRLEGELVQFRQRMAARHDHAAVPPIARHHHQVAEQFQPLGCDGEIDRPVGGHFGDLHRRTLVHVQRHVRVLLDEAADHLRQRITCLGVSGRDAQGALLFVGELLGDLLDALALAQNLASRGDDALSSRCHPRQMLATAGEHLDAEFILQQANLLADAGLRGEQTLGSCRNVEVMVRHFPDVTQLLKLHRNPSRQRHHCACRNTYNLMNGAPTDDRCSAWLLLCDLWSDSPRLPLSLAVRRKPGRRLCQAPLRCSRKRNRR